MATFPANPVVGTTEATLGACTYELTARGWEVQGSPGTPGSATDVFSAISMMRNHVPNVWQSALADDDGEDEGPILTNTAQTVYKPQGAVLGTAASPSAPTVYPVSKGIGSTAQDLGEFSTENRVVAVGSPGPGPFSNFALWRDPTDGKVFLYVKDTNGVCGWVQAS